MRIIDINCDMGEKKGDDSAIMKFISSSNIACGGHAGDSYSIRKSIHLSRANGVRAGAHPGYADKENFGRRETGQAPVAILDVVLKQIQAFMAEAEKENSTASHIKLHGALYNRAACDYELMLLLASGILKEFGNIPFFTLAGSVSEKAIVEAGGIYFSEGFAERSYDCAGNLVSRSIEGSVLHDISKISKRVLDMARTGRVQSIDREEITVSVDTICVHGDTLGAVSMAAAINEILVRNGIAVGRCDAL